MPNTLSLKGATAPKPTRFAPLWNEYFFSGLYTNRNILRGAGSRQESLYFGNRLDTLIDGLNVEITTRLTIARRPGLSIYNSATWTSPDYFYEFRLFNQNVEQIKVMVDQANALYDGTGPSTQSIVWTKSAGAVQTYMQSVANSLYFGNGVDQKKWLNTLLTWQPNTAYDLIPYNLNTFILDPNGNIQQLINTIFPVTNVSITGNVLTVTSSANLPATIQVGNEIVFSGLTNATFLNNLDPNVTPITVLTISTNQFTAAFTYAGTYSSPDTGTATVLVGGTPVTGPVQPTWNTTLLGTTNDGTAQWRNRGVEIENWGIAPPTSAPDLVVSGAALAWQPNTWYSLPQVIVDSNGNLQKLTTGGKSGTVTPTWATSVGNTTPDNTVTWTMVQTSASLSWNAHTAYTPGHFLVEAASGTPCLFELQNFTGVQLSSAVQAYLWASPHTGPVGAVTNVYPTSVGSALASASGNSLLFNPPTIGDQRPVAWATLNGAGEITGSTVPFPAYASDYQLSLQTGFVIPAAGQYTFTIVHQDGMFWGIGAGVLNVLVTDVQITSNVLTITSNETLTNILNVGVSVTFSGLTNATFLNTLSVTVTSISGNQFTATIGHADYGPTAETSPTAFASVSSGNTPTLISGPNNNGFGQTQTFVLGYPILTANNVSGSNTDTAVIYFPTAGTYPVEVNYDYWFHSGQTLQMTCNTNNIVPEPAESGPTQPVWPAWTTSFAPSYPAVTESSGNLTWWNVGPASDFVWHAATNYTTTTSIVDPNSNKEAPYRTGVSGTTIPTFATTINSLTLDNPNLTWINQGPASSAPANTISTFNGGWKYYIALVNTLDNTVSDVGPVSVSTGNFFAGTGVHVSGGLPTVIDPQVDYVAIFRTQDGGATFYLVPGDGNTQYTVLLSDYEANGYTDNTPDTELNTFIQAPANQENALPPKGIINLTYHLSRIFGSVGNTVYWSTGPDTPVVNGINGFSPANYAIFPSLVKCLVPVSFGLLVFTVSDIYLIYGSGTSSSPLTPVPYLTGIGLLSYNALSINGSVIYFFTSDSQIVSLEPSSGVAEIGFPIGDQFEQAPWSPSSAYLTWHVSGSRDKAIYVADGVDSWFRMIPTPSPESGETWCPKATIAAGCKTVLSVETVPGVHRLLVGPSGTGPILYRNLSVFSDNGSIYPAFFTIGSIVLAQPGQLAQLGFITTDSIRTGKPLTLGILRDEIEGVFDPLNRWVVDPTQLDRNSTSLYAQRFYFSQTDEPALCRHLQIKVQWEAEAVQNELLSSTLWGGFSTE